MIGAKPLGIRFDRIDGFIRIYDGNRCLELFGFEKYDTIDNSVRYLISQKSGITYVLFSLLREKQSWFLWFFAYRRTLKWCYNTHQVGS